MNQILLQVLSQDSLKTSGVYLSLQWLLPLVPHLEEMVNLLALPILGTWLGCIFFDLHDLCDQVFSLTGILYIGTFISMLPKPNTSSKLWMDANLFTVVCYFLYFAELALLAYFGFNLDYSIGWIASIIFSTSLTFLCYGTLLKLGLSSIPYLKTIVRIYLLSDLGNLLALGFISPFNSYKISLLILGVLLSYLLLPYRYPHLFANVKSPLQFTQGLTTIRCILWGALSVWADYISFTPFYLLEAIVASNDQHKETSAISYIRKIWDEQRISVFLKYQRLKCSLLLDLERITVFALKEKRILINQILIPLQPQILIMGSHRALYCQNLKEFVS